MWSPGGRQVPLEHGSQLDNVARLRRLLANGYVHPIMQRARHLHLHICFYAGAGYISLAVCSAFCPSSST